MLDSSSVPLEKFVFASGTRKSFEGRRRHVADAFATVSWFHELRLRTGAESVYRMAALFGGPGGPGSTAAGNAKSRWQGYSKGSSSPGESVIREIEVLHPGCEAVYRSALWEVLRVGRIDPMTVSLVLGRVGPEISAVARLCMTASTGWLTVGARWDGTSIAMLERRAGPDALAVLLLGARWALQNGHARTAFRLSGAVCTMLLLTGPWLHQHGVAGPLSEYVGETVLAHGLFEGRRHRFWTKGYLAALRRLVAVANGVIAHTPDMLPQARRQLLLELLQDRYTVELSGLVEQELVI